MTAGVPSVLWRKCATLFCSALACALPFVSPAQAQVVGSCDWKASAENIAEPWETQSRTFANGDIRLAVLDVVEPAAGAFHLLVLSPPRDDMGFLRCQIVSAGGDIGFGSISFERLEAEYDPARGLTVTIPVTVYSGESGDFFPIRLSVTTNQQNGLVQVGF